LSISLLVDNAQAFSMAAVFAARWAGGNVRMD
jgi:hypothetical protein